MHDTRASKVKWPNIQTVLLDMDGTLLDLHYDNHFWMEFLPGVYADKHVISLEDSRAQLSKVFKDSQGTLHFYCVEHWSEKLDLDIVNLKKQETERIAFLPDAEKFLAAINAIADRPSIAIATNAHREVFEVKDRKLGLRRYVDDIFCANELGAPKESKEYWDRLQERFPFDPETTLFVDDNQTVLGAATSFGISNLIMPLKPDTKKPPQQNQRGYQAINSLREITPGAIQPAP